ncbi:Light-harvest protein [Chondrus crispus]|uniref:Light-harvest protein n=1 Tax=Chondrus crispus TaxID=2769 RepID=R7QMN6_CHOCR|nr:Light-harvest protein [Chondrus crispus]CDF39364.1 Light-harvest protein [Chondrus crispus]|eukprot:XP_005719275.1 Light-harvest protein [Chondrus crispus]
MIAFVSGFAGASVARSNAFSGTSVSTRSAPVVANVSMSMSKSIPYMERPAKLDGSLPGDVGFDPLGISNMFELDFLREAEVKHGRICMLAIVGWVFPEMVYHLPNAAYSVTNPLYAVPSVGFLPCIQILLFMAVCEAAAYKKVYEQNCENPGDFGIDPLGFSKTPERKAHYQLAEIKNGRLAMIAIGGAIHHALLTNVGLWEQIQSGMYTGGYYIH